MSRVLQHLEPLKTGASQKPKKNWSVNEEQCKRVWCHRNQEKSFKEDNVANWKTKWSTALNAAERSSKRSK